MASVQEVVEQMLDAKLETLMEVQRKKVAEEESSKYRRRLVVVTIIGVFVLAFTFVTGYRSSFLINKNAYQSCMDRNGKEEKVTALADTFLSQELAQPIPRGAPGYAEQQAREAKLLALKTAYSTPTDCTRFQ